MTYVTALLPVAKGVGVYAALKRAADTTFDDRSRGAVMADTLFERVTGRSAEVADSVAVNLVIADETLLGADDGPAVVEGYGPIPASVARGLVNAAVTDEQVAGDVAAAVPPPENRRVGGDGVAVAVLPEGAGRLHRAARPDMSHAVL